MTTYPGLTTYPGPSTYPDPPDFYAFTGPTTTVHYQLEGRLWGDMEVGLNVRRDALGAWHTELYTTDDNLQAATAFYQGGRNYVLGESAADALTAGGFGAYLTILEDE